MIVYNVLVIQTTSGSDAVFGEPQPLPRLLVRVPLVEDPKAKKDQAQVVHDEQEEPLGDLGRHLGGHLRANLRTRRPLERRKRTWPARFKVVVVAGVVAGLVAGVVAGVVTDVMAGVMVRVVMVRVVTGTVMVRVATGTGGRVHGVVERGAGRVLVAARDLRGRVSSRSSQLCLSVQLSFSPCCRKRSLPTHPRRAPPSSRGRRRRPSRRRSRPLAYPRPSAS